MTAPSQSLLSVNPKDPGVPESLRHLSGDDGKLVLLLADLGAREAGWSEKFAVALAREWAGSGHHVLLADAILDDPTLHGHLGIGNGEGVADLIHFGASRSRVARAVEGEDFLLISTGTPVADASESYRTSRWRALADSLRGDGDVVLMYLAAETPGIVEWAANGGRVIRLSGGPEEVTTEAGSVTIVAEAVEAPKAAAHSKASAGAAAPAQLLGAAPAEPPAAESVRPARIPTAPAKPGIVARPLTQATFSLPASVWLLIGLIAAVILLLIAAWMGLVQIPGITPASTSLFITFFAPSTSTAPRA